MRQVLKSNAIRGEKRMTVSPAESAPQHCRSVLGKTGVRRPANKHWNGTTPPWRPSQEQLPGTGRLLGGGVGAICTELSQKESSTWTPLHQHRSQGSWEDECAECRWRWHLPCIHEWSILCLNAVCLSELGTVPWVPASITVVLERAVRDGKNFSSSWFKNK